MTRPMKTIFYHWNSKVQLVLLFCLLLLCQLNLTGQLYLQYEESGSLERRKYAIGDKIVFKHKSFGNQWINDEIVNIMYRDNSLLLLDQIIQVDEITHFSYNRPWARTTGFTLQTFGVAWLGFGGAIEGLRRVGAIDTQYEFGLDTAIIGVTSLVSGYIINKAWSKARKKMNKNQRLRLLDLTF
jgi:hypothetical protein